MLKIYDKHIDHWCWRCISLEGRLILDEYVLEKLAVHWLYLCKIPIQILNNIRNKFLWSRNYLEYSKLHLVKWEHPAFPKEKGGWVLKNILCFSKSLLAKISWIEIFGNNLWCKVMKFKYFRKITVT